MYIEITDRDDGYYDVTMTQLIFATLWICNIRYGDYDKHGKQGPVIWVNLWNPVSWLVIIAAAIATVFVAIFFRMVDEIKDWRKYRSAPRLSTMHLWRLWFQQTKAKVAEALDAD